MSCNLPRVIVVAPSPAGDWWSKRGALFHEKNVFLMAKKPNLGDRTIASGRFSCFSSSSLPGLPGEQVYILFNNPQNNRIA
jgi:hypothetical protein